MRPPGTVSSQARGRVSAAGLLRRQGLLGRVAAADGPQRVTTATRWDHYLLAGDVHRPNRVEVVMTTSLSKTPACKQDPTVTKMASRFNATIATPFGPRRCFQASVEHADRKPLVARFGGIPLRPKKNAVLYDRDRPPLIVRRRPGRCR